MLDHDEPPFAGILLWLDCFGAWKYEVGNMDHSFMQGVEFVNHVMAAGEDMTLWYPGVVNSTHSLEENGRTEINRYDR